MMDIISRKEASEKGLQWYFTGNFCKVGHTSKRYTNSRICVRCAEEYRKKYYKENSDKEKKVSQIWYRNNKDVVNSRSQIWARNHPEKIRIQGHRYRTRKAGSGGTYFEADYWMTLDAQHWFCNNPYCEVDLYKTGCEADHIIPVSQGGTSNISNIQALCPDCNKRKGSKSWEEFLRNEACVNAA